MKEREGIISQQPSQFMPGMPVAEPSAQAKEIQQLQAVKAQLSALQSKILGQPEAGSQFTNIMNPSVQNNLNTLIKSQRDEIIRMS